MEMISCVTTLISCIRSVSHRLQICAQGQAQHPVSAPFMWTMRVIAHSKTDIKARPHRELTCKNTWF